MGLPCLLCQIPGRTPVKMSLRVVLPCRPPIVSHRNNINHFPQVHLLRGLKQHSLIEIRILPLRQLCRPLGLEKRLQCPLVPLSKKRMPDQLTPLLLIMRTCIYHSEVFSVALTRLLLGFLPGYKLLYIFSHSWHAFVGMQKTLPFPTRFLIITRCQAPAEALLKIRTTSDDLHAVRRRLDGAKGDI